MRLQRNLRLMDAYTIGTNMLFVLPVIMPYYRDQIGLGFREFLIGEAAFAATIVLLEVPTGWLSDVWQRKHTLALGFFFDLVGYACLLVADSLFMAVLAQMLIGIGISLCSGTNTAILYDSLLSAGREKEYRKREGRRMAIGFYTTAFSGVIGGLLYPLHHQLPVTLMTVTMLVAIVMACMLDEPERHKKRTAHHPLKDMAVTLRYALHGHAEVAFIIFFSAALFCSTKLIMWAQQPYYMAMKVPEAWYGVLMAAGFMLGGASSHFGHLLDGRLGPYRALAFFWALAFGVCLVTSFYLGWTGAALLMVAGTCIFGAAAPRVNEAINDHIDSSRRATILSTQNLMTSLLFIPVSTAIAHISGQGGVQTSLLGIAVWLSFAGLCLGMFFLYRRKKPALKNKD